LYREIFFEEFVKVGTQVALVTGIEKKVKKEKRYDKKKYLQTVGNSHGTDRVRIFYVL